MWPARPPFAGRSTPHERRNGKFVLQVTCHPSYGVPFGQDRIVPIFLATLAIQQKSQTIQFKSAAEMLETFGMSKGGKEYRRLVAVFERTFGATIFFRTDSLTSSAKVVHRARFNFFSEARIWYNRENGIEIPELGQERKDSLLYTALPEEPEEEPKRKRQMKLSL